MWRKFLLATVVAAVLAHASAIVVVEPESVSVRVRECDELVFRMTTSGTYSSPYSVTVICVPIMAGGGAADFAGQTAMNNVRITMDMQTVEVPLPLNDDTAMEQNEKFRCFFLTSGGAGVRGGQVELTVIDNDFDCPMGQTAGCGMVPPPNCNTPNPTQTEGVGCFCPHGMLIKANDTCVLPANCVDCPTGQAARFSKSPGPTCVNPNPAEEPTESHKCFCPDGMLIKADGTCVLPANCIDCPAGQTPRFSKSPGPTCENPNPAEEQTESFKCFCPDGMLIKMDGSCVLPVDCIDCPGDQTPQLSKAPAPTCSNRNPPEEPTTALRCFCPDDKVMKEATCVIPDDCGSVTAQASGDPHYRTYDGHFYDLFDHCSHIITKDCADNTFTVISITSNQCSGGGAPTCIDRAVVQVPRLKTEIVLTGRPLQFTFVGDAPPAAELSVVTTNVITVSIFKLGVVVNFGLYYLSVTVPGSYFGKMCGLFGTYDGNSANDFQLPNGTVVNGPTPHFEIAYRTNYSKDGCDSMDPQPAPACTGTALQQAETFCNVLRQTGGPFSACHGTISPDQAFADCVLDHCSCDSKLCECSVILNYAERCQALGITVGPIPTLCVPACPEGLVYSICSPNLPPTCADQAGQSDPCRPGCACPPGKVLKKANDLECVEPVLCEGKIDLPEKDPKFRTCHAWGDPHYTTFDGLVHHFQGVCYYNYVFDCKENLFHVYSKQERCGTGVTCTTGVVIEVKGYTGRIEISRNGDFSPDIATLPANIFQVMRSGSVYTVDILPLKVTVYFGDWWTINVKIPDTFFGKVCGLCGNANEDPNDDFQALVNGSLQLEANVAKFGLSWANFELSEEYGCEVENASPGPCEGSKRRRAEQFCKKLRSKAITTGCLDLINPQGFINNCIFDYCASETAPGVVSDYSAVCSHFALYCSKCTELLGKPTELPPECLPQCEEGEDYSICGPAQEGTCIDPMPVMQAGTCTPGCSCMEGFVRHEGKCIKFTDCPVIASFQCKSYSVKEGDGICLPLKAAGTLNRDFEVTMSLGKQFAADGSGTAPCSCKSPGDAQVCGGSDSCTISFSTGAAEACVYIKMDGDDTLEDDRTETLTLTAAAGDGITIGNSGEIVLLVIDDDFNALTFETTAYYYTESKLADNHYVRLSKASGAPVFAELLQEGGDGDTAAAAGLDFQSGIVQPYFVRRQRALFYVLVFKEKIVENAECFYMTLRSPKNGSSYNPEIRAWMPSRAVGWIQSEKNRHPPTSGRDGLSCFHEPVPIQDVCKNDVVALVTFESEINSKNCRLGWNATVRRVIKGGDLIPQTAVNVFVLPVMGCNDINFKRGEHYLVAGSLETAGVIGTVIHDVSVGNSGQVVWDSTKYAPVLQRIQDRCG